MVVKKIWLLGWVLLLLGLAEASGLLWWVPRASAATPPEHERRLATHEKQYGTPHIPQRFATHSPRCYPLQYGAPA